jgi:hypothetical protein
LIFGKRVLPVYACNLSFPPGSFMALSPVLKRLLLSIACLVMLGQALQVAAYECGSMPVPYSASYSVARNGDPDGSMRVVLERTSDDTFSYMMETRVKWGIFIAHIEQRSNFSWQDGVVLPGSYHATQRVSIYKRSETANFDWRAMKARGVKKRDDFEIDLVPGMQDKLTVYLALARAFCEGKDTIGIEVVSGPKIKLHEYTVQSHGPLDTPPGDPVLVHIMRGGPGEEKQTDLWLSKKNRFLPERMIYRDEDIITVMQLVDISFEDEP